MEKSLKSKAVKIQGKSYVLVSDRVVYFNETYPNGRIETILLSELDAPVVYMKAIVTPDVEKPNRCFTGFSQAVVGGGMVNKTAALENCETSAVGRALAMMGIGVIESIASVDEINKAGNNNYAGAVMNGKATDKQKDAITRGLNKLQIDLDKFIVEMKSKIKTLDDLSKQEASAWIEELKARYEVEKSQQEEIN
jgi:hypothetical protein